MAELIRTNDVALISVVEGLLQEAEIPCHVADRHTSGLEGGMNWLQMRVLVPDEKETEARQLLTDAELGEWLAVRPARTRSATRRAVRHPGVASGHG
jgi:putative signal transducing protein